MKRVIYQLNPLIEVILQLRFPTILSIGSNEPAVYQESIRNEFPVYQLGIENEQTFSIDIENADIGPAVVSKQHKNYAFISADGNCKINLTNSFISISTIKYTRWEEFLSRFELPLNSFIKQYKPQLFERIGLRYINAFSREKLNLNDRKWCDLIEPNWLGVLNIADEESIHNCAIDAEYLLSDMDSRVKVHAGLGKENLKNEIVFVVDSDFIHTKSVESGTQFEVFEKLHIESNKFINSIIKEKLHIAMKPEEISD